MLLQHCCRFWQQFRTSFFVKFHAFDKAETNQTCSTCFEFVERTKLRSALLPFFGNNVAEIGKPATIGAEPTGATGNLPRYSWWNRGKHILLPLYFFSLHYGLLFYLVF